MTRLNANNIIKSRSHKLLRDYDPSLNGNRVIIRPNGVYSQVQASMKFNIPPPCLSNCYIKNKIQYNMLFEEHKNEQFVGLNELTLGILLCYRHIVIGPAKCNEG